MLLGNTELDRLYSGVSSCSRNIVGTLFQSHALLLAWQDWLAVKTLDGLSSIISTCIQAVQISDFDAIRQKRATLIECINASNCGFMLWLVFPKFQDARIDSCVSHALQVCSGQ